MHLGLIGGIGPAATEYYYRGLVDRHARAGTALELTIAHADLRELARNAANGDAAAQADSFARLVRRLAAAGAQEIASPADPIAKAAFDALNKNCARCHQEGKLQSREKPAKNFGFVLDLDRSSDRTSHGFIHAPSLPHAASAAVLRSGWMSRGNNDNESPAAIDLAPGGVDHLAFAERQAKKPGTQAANHEQQPLARAALIQVTGAWDQPGQQGRQRRIAQVDFKRFFGGFWRGGHWGEQFRFRHMARGVILAASGPRTIPISGSASSLTTFSSTVWRTHVFRQRSENLLYR